MLLGSSKAKTAIRIERMDDISSVAGTMTHPRVYPHVSDDFSPAPGDLANCLHPVDSVFYLAAYDGEEYLGLFFLHQHNSVMYEVHTCLLPNAWGGRSVDAAKACAAWMFENTPCQRIVTYVPVDNVLALRLARNSGMQQIGINHDSIMRGGKLVSQHMLGLSKE